MALAAAAGALLLVAATPAKAETVSGTFRFADRTAVHDGSPDLRPIAHAKVEIWRCVPGFLGFCTWGNARTVKTDAHGRISEWFDHAARGTTYGVRVFATNDSAVVWPNDVAHTVPFHREPGGDDNPGQVINLKANSSGDVLDFSYDFSGWSAQHYNIAEAIRHGHDYASARRDPREGDGLGRVNVQPTSASPGGSFYNFPVDTIVLESDMVFEDFLILHEYAHFVEEQISTFAVIPSKHTGCDTDVGPPFGSPSELAWMEGFADYFAGVVRKSAPPGTLKGTSGRGTPSLYELENPEKECPGIQPADRNKVELFVAGLLWDLHDSDNADEPFDVLAGLDREVLEIADYELDARLPRWPTVDDFRGAWVRRGLPGPDPVPTPPETTISAGPPEGSTTTESRVRFTFSSNRVRDGFECSVDHGPFESCASPHTTPSLPDGAHSFRVRAVTAGLADPTPAARAFTVDTDADSDGVPNSRDNCREDPNHDQRDTDRDDRGDACDSDDDGDGLTDQLEDGTGTNPVSPDTDRDGLSDGVEDRDKDGRRDARETDPRKRDTDRDGLSDGVEDRDKDGRRDARETDPRKRDTDGDGVRDGADRFPLNPRRS